MPKSRDESKCPSECASGAVLVKALKSNIVSDEEISGRYVVSSDCGRNEQSRVEVPSKWERAMG